MNNRVKRVLGYTQPMSKQAGWLEDLATSSKGVILTALMLATATGAVSGWAAEKVTAPVETDFDNARGSYAVGNLKANLMSNINKLRDERMKVTNKKQRTLRLG